ncbi:uncharacterized protein LOC107790019 isoform X6 [Nicotiana tabacum]|uniref:Uncharacterized protein LOC107790019 isoform X6 n=1 Tax=Nicotiana tabacum TaxID=4097 RepID=A0AC58TIB1_TOBAC
MDPSGGLSNRGKQEIQPQISVLGMELGRPSDEEEKTLIKDQLFEACMENRWTEVNRLYINDKFVQESKLTKSEDTVLHLAISSYHPHREDSSQQTHLDCIKDMVANIPKENRLCILKQKNEKGNTPLHLAAELGSVPIIACLVNPQEPELIWETNSKGETPLFVAAYRGRLDAFLYLHECCQNEKSRKDPIVLCRRGDGDNILHAAISGEYFKLAFQIINHYGLLVNRLNSEGMSPLHFLSRMPQVFKSGSHFRYIDSIIYYCITVEELKIEKYKTEGIEDTYRRLPDNWKLPDNYQTLVEFLELLWNGTANFLDYIKEICSGKQANKSKALTEETNVKRDKKSPGSTGVTNVNRDKKSPGNQDDSKNPPIPATTGVTNVNQDKKSPGNQDDPENPPTPATTGVTNVNQDKKSRAQGKRNGNLFPANYTTFINFVKLLMKILLIIMGIGLQRTKKLEEKKKHHQWAVKIMKLMIGKEKSYKFYENTGEKPEDKDLYDQGLYKQIGKPPPAPPPTDINLEKAKEPSNIAQIKQPATSSTDNKKKDDIKSVLNTEVSKTKATPLLVASKMGIVEMVTEILKKFPIAIQDTDSDEKNILLLAVEHRQTAVYNWLIGQKYPECVFYHVDKQENNAVHLAASFQKHDLWRIPGTALQLQGERKWYKYVKHTLPKQSYVRYNKKGQTPREIFRETHAMLLKEGTEWLVTTSNSFSVVAALIATVAFATASAVPGGADDYGRPYLESQPAFSVFSISSLVSLCFSVTALVFFLAILTSRCQHSDFEKDLPRKLLLGLTSLFASITAILVSFCAAHFFVLQDKLRKAAFPIYGVTCIPVVFFAFNQFPLYVDLIRSYVQQLPLRSYKVFYTESSGASSSDQKKEGKEKDD